MSKLFKLDCELIYFLDSLGCRVSPKEKPKLFKVVKKVRSLSELFGVDSINQTKKGIVKWQRIKKAG